MIAFGSIEHGVGTTCASLALANYLCSKLGKKIAYIELNTTDQICCLAKQRNCSCFSYMGITFFPSKTITSLHEVLIMPFDHFILDIGVLNTYTVTEFAKCNEQFLVCSLCEWKKALTLEKIDQFMQKNYLHQEYVTILGNVDIKKSKLSVSPSVTCRFFPLPLIENPFHLDWNHVEFFHQLLF